MNYSICRLGPRCRDRILWVHMESGKRAPLNADPDDERGNILLDMRGIGHPLSKGTARVLRDRGEDLYLNHHATCAEWAAQEAERRRAKAAAAT